MSYFLTIYANFPLCQCLRHKQSKPPPLYWLVIWCFTREFTPSTYDANLVTTPLSLPSLYSYLCSSIETSIYVPVLSSNKYLPPEFDDSLPADDEDGSIWWYIPLMYTPLPYITHLPFLCSPLLSTNARIQRPNW